MEKETQHKQIERYIREYGSITPFEAFAELGITKLATRISEMKKKGIVFQQEMVHSMNRNGSPVEYMRYWLV